MATKKGTGRSSSGGTKRRLDSHTHRSGTCDHPSHKRTRYQTDNATNGATASSATPPSTRTRASTRSHHMPSTPRRGTTTSTLPGASPDSTATPSFRPTVPGDSNRTASPDTYTVPTNERTPPATPNSPCNTDVPDYETPQRRRARRRWRRLLSVIMLTKRRASIGHAARSSLCETCEQLHLTLDTFIIGRANTQPVSLSGLDTGKRQLGNMAQIYSRSFDCPMCRLIVKALAEQLAPKKPDFSLDFALQDKDTKCLIHLQVDGRERVMDAQGESREVQKTRCLCVQWPDSDYKDAHLVLVHPNRTWGPDKLFLGRLLTSREAPLIDTIKDWYRICCDDHAEFCKGKHNPHFEDLRKESYFGVIDVQEMMLCALPKGARYAALSYVWGSSQGGQDRFKTQIDNVEQVMRPGGINTISHSLPRTITDTIKLVQQLGLRYLWVDSLCILQGDADIWALNASKMDAIYGSAHLTIAGADGDGAHVGLKALHELPSKYDHHHVQHIEQYGPDLRLMVTYPPEAYVERAIWNTRAWTFQEKVLSNRLLIFVEGRVYFQCPSITMSEDIYAEEAKSGWSIGQTRAPLPAFQKVGLHAVEVYKNSVHEFTERKLSKEQDILAAFSGIGTDICNNLGGQMVHGLPSTHFDYAMLWQLADAPHRRLHFPSWAWSGWKDVKVRYDSSFLKGIDNHLHDWLMKHTWITWYIRDGQGNLRLVWDSKLVCAGKKENTSQMEPRWRGYMCPDTMQDSQSSPGAEEGNLTRMDRYGRRLNHVRPGVAQQRRTEFFKTMPKYPYQVRLVEPGHLSARSDLPDQPILQFWTWSAYFYLQPEQADSPFSHTSKPIGAHQRRWCMKDAYNNFSGLIVLDGTFVSEPDKPHEFIAISDAKKISKDEYDAWTYPERAERNSIEWYAYYVLLLNYDESPRVARRVGLGKMLKQAFDMPCRAKGVRHVKKWKEILLG